VTLDREQLRWNGWGRLGQGTGFSPDRERWLLEALGRRLGRPLARGAEPVSLDEIRLPPPKLSADVVALLRSACGDESVRTSAFERITHSVGRSLPDLFRLRRGEIPQAPDVVVYPPDEGAVAAVLRIAIDSGAAVVPVGGGTSVVGGTAPTPSAGQDGVIALDTTHLDRLVHFDPQSGHATFQAGIDGPGLESELRERGATLGHFPQSFEHSTLGGWIAARSTGQLSNRYGGIEDLVVAVRVVTPAGVLRTKPVPRSATGPDLNELVLGSEGTLGVIVEATLRTRRAPSVTREGGILFRTFHDGVSVVREAMQAEIPTAMLRLSDAEETALGELLRRDPARRVDTTDLALRALSRLGFGRERTLLVHGFEGGDAGTLRRARARLRSRALAHGGLPLGSGPGRAWRRERFQTPYLRDWLLDHGVAADTLETAVPWQRVEGAHVEVLAALRASLQAHAGGGIAMGHLSHSYPDGACLYFTILYPFDASQPVAQWRRIKRDATRAVLEAGGTLSHHHGVGSDHAAWLADERGSVGLAALRGAKERLDPAGVMNPGKLAT
jgi:alkyldihydroxyacetonephosphate synthase